MTSAVDPGELALCRRLAAEAGDAFEKPNVPGSAGGNYFDPFYNVAGNGGVAPTASTLA